eukprot:2905391-Rhodomonas_salina.2
MGEIAEDDAASNTSKQNEQVVTRTPPFFGGPTSTLQNLGGQLCRINFAESTLQNLTANFAESNRRQRVSGTSCVLRMSSVAGHGRPRDSRRVWWYQGTRAINPYNAAAITGSRCACAPRNTIHETAFLVLRLQFLVLDFGVYRPRPSARDVRYRRRVCCYQGRLGCRKKTLSPL